MAIVLFPSLPFDLHAEDPSWAAERAASRAAGLGTALVDHTRVLAGESPAAVARVERGAGTAVWRGWMMPPARYAELFEALDARGVHLINDPAAYRRCHYLPEVLPFLGEDTPGSVWLPVTGDVRFEDVHERLRVFGSAPLVLKDFVKSQKHHWDAACFIPAADDRARVEAVTRRFLELQGEDLAEGLVYRAYVPLARVGVHPKSGTPLAAEWRPSGSTASAPSLTPTGRTSPSSSRRSPPPRGSRRWRGGSRAASSRSTSRCGKTAAGSSSRRVTARSPGSRPTRCAPHSTRRSPRASA